MAGRPPNFPAGHPMASKYMQQKAAKEEVELGGIETWPEITFSHANFNGYISPSTMKFGSKGEMRFEVTVPFGPEIDKALELRKLAMQSILLNLEVVPDPNFLADYYANRDKMAELDG